MDISSSTSTANTSSTAAVSDNKSASSAQKTDSDKSFKEELEKVSSDKNNDGKKTEEAKTGQNTENTENKSDATPMNKAENKDSNQTKNGTLTDLNQSMLLSGEINMAAINPLMNNKLGLSNNLQALMDANKQLVSISMMNEAKITAKVDYSNFKMDDLDAKFFSDLVKNTDMTMQSISAEVQKSMQEDVQQVQKNVKVSATLMNALTDAVKTNQPFRIDFGKDISVIIQVNKDGALSAKFIPGDKAVEEYLRQNISSLRQSFDEQELPYSDLSYSRQRQHQENNKRNNKENKHE